MKSGTTRWVAAVSVALLATAALYWLPLHRPASDARASAPLATPPGITLQLRAVGARPPRTGSAPVIYADANGMTLYVLDRDHAQGTSTCSGECAKRWPPAIAPPGAMRDARWSHVGRADGRSQWTYRGAPLYRFADDQAIGQAGGDGAEGGVWHVATFRPGDGMTLPDAVMVREIPDAGGAGLVDSDGMTLYVRGALAAHREPSCSRADCMGHFLPLEAPEIANVVGDFSVLMPDNGISQWAYRGEPLFRFDGDRRPGDVNGIGPDARVRVALIVRQFMPADATIRRNPELGNILVIASGATLYERDRPATDEGHNFRENHGWPALGRSFGTATCDEACAKSWPPYTAPPDALPCGYWGVANRPDGGRQWVYKGYALYTFAADQPGDYRGNLLYDLAPVHDVPEIDAPRGAAHSSPGAAGAAGLDPFVPAGGDVAGIGVGAMFWHAVVP